MLDSPYSNLILPLDTAKGKYRIQVACVSREHFRRYKYELIVGLQGWMC